MAVLSKKLSLTTTWQEIGAVGFVGEGAADLNGKIEILNANALPTGDQDGAIGHASDATLSYPAPATGSLYVRMSEGTGTLNYYEV